MAQYAQQASHDPASYSQWYAAYQGQPSYQQPGFWSGEYGPQQGAYQYQLDSTAHPPRDTDPPPPPDEHDGDESLAPPGQEAEAVGASAQQQSQQGVNHTTYASQQPAYGASFQHSQPQPTWQGQELGQPYSYDSTGHGQLQAGNEWSQQAGQQAANEPPWATSLPQTHQAQAHQASHSYSGYGQAAGNVAPGQQAGYQGYYAQGYSQAPGSAHTQPYAHHQQVPAAAAPALSQPAFPGSGPYTAAHQSQQPQQPEQQLQQQESLPASQHIQPQVGFGIGGRTGGVKMQMKKKQRLNGTVANGKNVAPVYTSVPPPGSMTSASAMAAARAPTPAPSATVSVSPPPSSATSTATAAAAAKGPSGYPEAMRDYVHRAYKSCMNDEPKKARVTAELRDIIADCDRLGKRWTRRWEMYPLPASTGISAPAGVPHSVSISSSAAKGYGSYFAPSTAAADQTFSNSYSFGRHRASPRSSSSESSDESEDQLRITPARRPQQLSRKQQKKQAWFEKQQLQNQQLQHGKKSKKSKAKQRARQGSVSEMDESEDDRGTKPLYPRLDPTGAGLEKFQERNSARAERFGNGALAAKRAVAPKDRTKRKAASVSAADNAGEAEKINWALFDIKGTCTELEKSYFRLHAPPHPFTVRPPRVLEKALARLLRLIRMGQVKYIYAADQFKGMRQDLTVQRIGDGLAVRIYEAAARAALEHGDLPEYNQCQARLGALYRAGAPGCRHEFLAYRILYQVAHAQGGGNAALVSTLHSVSGEAAKHPAVLHAMKVRQASAAEDAPKLCCLYAGAPHMQRALLDLIMRRTRFSGLQSLTRAFAPGSVPVAFVCRVLGFVGRYCDGEAGEQAVASGGETDAVGVLSGCSRAHFPGAYGPQEEHADAIETCAFWLAACNAVIKAPASGDEDALVDCKASKACISMPEDTTAVAHGDTNLALEDFMKAAIPNYR